MNFEKINKELFGLLPIEQKERVFQSGKCDIDSEFLGFVDTYKYLSLMIPKHYTIIDLGCAYNPQCFFFKEHVKYIAVDFLVDEIFKSENCDFYKMSIKEFITSKLPQLKLNLDTTFAICNFVPSWGDDNQRLVRVNFKNYLNMRNSINVSHFSHF